LVFQFQVASFEISRADLEKLN